MSKFEKYITEGSMSWRGEKAKATMEIAYGEPAVRIKSKGMDIRILLPKEAINFPTKFDTVVDVSVQV